MSRIRLFAFESRVTGHLNSQKIHPKKGTKKRTRRILPGVLFLPNAADCKDFFFKNCPQNSVFFDQAEWERRLQVGELLGSEVFQRPWLSGVVSNAGLSRVSVCSPFVARVVVEQLHVFFGKCLNPP